MMFVPTENPGRNLTVRTFIVDFAGILLCWVANHLVQM